MPASRQPTLTFPVLTRTTGATPRRVGPAAQLRVAQQLGQSRSCLLRPVQAVQPIRLRSSPEYHPSNYSLRLPSLAGVFWFRHALPNMSCACDGHKVAGTLRVPSAKK